MLIAGPSGAGKSDLALRLIDRGATLISDDYTLLERVGDTVIATPPAHIAGKIEIRGLGILPLPHIERADIAMVVELTDRPERMPEADRSRSIAGLDIPAVEIDPHSASAAIKVEMALAHVARVPA